MLPLVLLVGAHLGLLLVFDLSARLLPSLSLLGLGFAALVWVSCRHGHRPPSAACILLVAGVLRALLLPLPSTLSDDLLRYVWDGRVTTAGFNPYEVAPEDETLASLRDDLWEQMPHKEVPTVYPPLALGLFSIAAWLPTPLLALKILLSLADLLTCFLLLKLAGRWRLPRVHTVWYAWNPLVVLEVAGMGHVDAVGVAFVAATLLALSRSGPGERGQQERRGGQRALAATAAAGAAAAAGALAKLAPLAAMPYWALRSRRPVVFTAVAGGLLLVVGLPVLISLGGAPPGLVTYGVEWEFNGPLYEPLWRALDLLRADVGAKALLDAYKEATEEWTRWNWIFPYLYPQFLAKLLLAAGAVLVVGRSVLDGLRRAPDARPGLGDLGPGGGPGVDLVTGTGRLLGTLLLLSATFYPWYLLWVLPWAALARHPAWRVLSGTILLSYVPQFTNLELFPWLFLLIWLPFWGVLILGPGWVRPEPAAEEAAERASA